MIIELLLLTCFSLYGVISIYDLLETYKNYGIIIDDTECNKVYYCNLINCILGCLLSVYIIAFIICQCLCKNIISMKMEFSLIKSIVLICFVGMNVWIGIQLYEDESCYTKYKIKNYNIAYIFLVILILCFLLVNRLFCSKPKKKDDNYESMD